MAPAPQQQQPVQQQQQQQQQQLAQQSQARPQPLNGGGGVAVAVAPRQHQVGGQPQPPAQMQGQQYQQQMTEQHQEEAEDAANLAHDEAQWRLGQNYDAHRRDGALPAEEEEGRDRPAAEVPERYYYLNVETLRRLQRNDPEVDSFLINTWDIDDWVEEYGRAIGDSTVLRRLCLDDDDRYEDASWIYDFGEGLSRNRSIEELEMYITHLIGWINEKEDIFPIIAPFFEQNMKLRSIAIHYATDSYDNYASYMEAMAACMRTNKHLRCVSFGGFQFQSLESCLESHLSSYWGMEREKEKERERFEVQWRDNERERLEAEKTLMELLITQKNLLELGISSAIGRLGITELANLLTHSESKIQSLDFWCDELDNEGAAILGTALATNKTLKKLKLPYLDLGNEGAAILGTALATNKTLKKLFLKKCGEWEVEGWRGFSDCLRSPLSALEELHIDNDLNGRTFQCMREVLMALSHNRHLKMLELGGNTTTGVMNEEHFICQVQQCVSNIICDATSIESTYSSNHTLCYVKVRRVEVEDAYLTMNQNENKASVARQKILMHHFTGHDEDINVFTQMPETILPHAISWIGRDSLGYSLMLNFVQGSPTLFHIPNVGHQHAGVKRKLC